VALVPGWGLRIVAVDAWDEPLEGVEVMANARPVGRTGADGTLCLELESRPSQLAFEHPTHRLIGLDLDPLEPPAVSRRGTYEIRMRRR
jgi:hypothetical protein